jgi:hypothetical protein
LDALFASADVSVKAQYGVAKGHAHLALAMLYDQAGQWSAARKHILQAIRSHPRLAASPAVLRRTLKLYAGQQATSSAKKLLAILRNDASLTTPSPKA